MRQLVRALTLFGVLAIAATVPNAAARVVVNPAGFGVVY